MLRRDEEQAKAGRERVSAEAARDVRFVKEETAKERKNGELIEAGQIPEEDDDDPSDEDGGGRLQIDVCRDMPPAGELDRSAAAAQQAKPFVSSAGPPSRRRCARRSRRWG